MCLIILFHARSLLTTSLSPVCDSIILRVGSLGTPTFTFISGLMLGYFLYRKDRRELISQRYVRRGVLLLAPTHLLNAIAVYPYYWEYYSFWDALIHRWFITDTIGVILLTTPLLAVLTPVSRLMVGVVMLMAWKPLDLIIISQSDVMLLVKEVLFGIHEEGEHILGFIHPLCPIMGIFLLGSFVGDRFAAALKESWLLRFTKRLAWSSVAMACICVFILSLWLVFKFQWLSLSSDVLRDMFYPHRFYSLLPLYLSICMGSFSLIVYRIEIQKRAGPVEEWAAVFGRTSLFTYIAQYCVIQGMPSLAGWKENLSIFEWLLFVVGGFVVLHAMARFYASRFQGKNGRPPRSQEPSLEPAGIPH